MKIKRFNANLSLLTLVLLLIHEGYQLGAYITFYYNPILTKASGRAVACCFIMHAILSAICVFALHDSKTIAYKKYNIRTVLQRVSAVMLFFFSRSIFYPSRFCKAARAAPDISLSKQYRSSIMPRYPAISPCLSATRLSRSGGSQISKRNEL